MNSPDSARDVSIKQEPEDISIKQEEPEDISIKQEPEDISIKQEEPEDISIKQEEPEDHPHLTAKHEEDDNEDLSSHCSEVEVELESDTEVTEDSDREETSGGVMSQSSQTPVFSCTDAITSQVLLHKHIKRSHNDLVQRKKSFHCKHCDKSFRKSSNLTRHQRIHIGEKSYQCKYCDKSFSTLSHLRKHQHVHTVTGDKLFHCTLCYKSFSKSRLLKAHLRVHTGEMQCKYCNKSFTRPGNLKRHLSCIHAEEKPFP